MAIDAQHIKDLHVREILSISWCHTEYISADIGIKNTVGLWPLLLRATVTNIEEGFRRWESALLDYALSSTYQKIPYVNIQFIYQYEA